MCGSTSLAYIGFTSIECNTDGCPLQTKIVQNIEGNIFIRYRITADCVVWEDKNNKQNFFYPDHLKSFEDWKNVIKRFNIKTFVYDDGYVQSVEATIRNLRSSYPLDKI